MTVLDLIDAIQQEGYCTNFVHHCCGPWGKQSSATRLCLKMARDHKLINNKNKCFPFNNPTKHQESLILNYILTDSSELIRIFPSFD